MRELAPIVNADSKEIEGISGQIGTVLVDLNKKIEDMIVSVSHLKMKTDFKRMLQEGREDTGKALIGKWEALKSIAKEYAALRNTCALDHSSLCLPKENDCEAEVSSACSSIQLESSGLENLVEMYALQMETSVVRRRITKHILPVSCDMGCICDNIRVELQKQSELLPAYTFLLHGEDSGLEKLDAENFLFEWAADKWILASSEMQSCDDDAQNSARANMDVLRHILLVFEDLRHEAIKTSVQHLEKIPLSKFDTNIANLVQFVLKQYALIEFHADN